MIDMKTLPFLFENNRAWRKSVLESDPEFFTRLAKQQRPKYLWIGCSDSRVPANQITGLDPGEVFVHRNIGNLVIHTDLNCLSVVQFAIEVLEIKDIIICGHYGCGGVHTAIEGKDLGLIDNWIRNIRDVYLKNSKELQKISNEQELKDRMCELNVAQQVLNLAHVNMVQQIWNSSRELNIHGWIYSINDGLLKDLGVGISSVEQLNEVYQVVRP